MSSAWAASRLSSGATRKHLVMAAGCCVLPDVTCYIAWSGPIAQNGRSFSVIQVFLHEFKANIGIIDLKPVHLRWICIVVPFVQNSACLEQRNTGPTPWGTQGEDSSLPLLMRVWTAGYTSQTSGSLVQTWINSNRETPWPCQIAKASLEARRFPLRLKRPWVVFRPSLTLSTFLADDVHRKGC